MTATIGQNDLVDIQGAIYNCYLSRQQSAPPFTSLGGYKFIRFVFFFPWSNSLHLGNESSQKNGVLW